MLMAGAAGRNLGKTEFSSPFVISRETPADDNNDTHRMFRAGATEVYWLRVKRPHLQEGLEALLDRIKIKTIEIDPDWYYNLNTPEDVNRYKETRK